MQGQVDFLPDDAPSPVVFLIPTTVRNRKQQPDPPVLELDPADSFLGGNVSRSAGYLKLKDEQ
jgi:hypothetical protein